MVIIMNIDQIMNDCKKRMVQAIAQTATDAEMIIDKSFTQFYSGGQPQIYDRKYILPDSKKINTSFSGNSASLEAGYDGSQLHYPEGMTWNGYLSKFTGPEVLDAVTSGTYKVVGDPTFDEVALKEILSKARENFNKAFS